MYKDMENHIESFESQICFYGAVYQGGGGGGIVTSSSGRKTVNLNSSIWW